MGLTMVLRQGMARRREIPFNLLLGKVAQNFLSTFRKMLGKIAFL